MSAASRSIATADALGRPGVQSVGTSVDFTPMVAGGRRSLFETARLLKENNHGAELSSRKAPFDIDALLHPSKTFRHPLDVVRDTDMTVAEKRSVLASWASDACAIESNPAQRATATGNVVNYDDIIDALQSPDDASLRTDVGRAAALRKSPTR